MDALLIERIWQDSEFYEIQVIAHAINVFSRVKVYIQDHEVNKLVNGVKKFCEEPNDKFFWNIGKRDQENSQYFSMIFHLVSKLGHAAINIYMENNPYFKSRFTIYTEIGLLERFADDLKKIKTPQIGVKVCLPDVSDVCVF